MKQILWWSILVCGCLAITSCTNELQNSCNDDTILCEKALDSILCGERHEVLIIQKVKETTHLQWCIETFTDLNVRKMLCENEYKLAKLTNNNEQARTALFNAKMFKENINKIQEQQDTATNNYPYEKVYEITYKTDSGNKTIELTFLDEKLSF